MLAAAYLIIQIAFVIYSGIQTGVIYSGIQTGTPAIG